MKIALIGYGKMGKAIEQIALQRGHEITLRIRTDNKSELTKAAIQQADVAIEFTLPHVAKDNVLFCLQHGTAVVCGTTGWNEQLFLAKEKAIEKKTAFLHASNFSIGVNIFFEINKLLASLMHDHPDYNVSISEVHHTQKEDAPSGTAITLAQQILELQALKKSWELAPAHDPERNIEITALREEGVPGTHTVTYNSAIDTIEISHVAHSRDGFAQGAVLAAEFLYNKKGIYTMKDVLGI